MDISKQEKLNQVQKILKSRALTGSDSLKGFLRFVSEKAIEHPDNQLKEYVIATEVFGRNEDYNPRIDSTVRVQAGRLRTKLSEYYSTEGKHDKVLIDLPKGQYTPVFSFLEHTEQVINETHAAPTSDKDSSLTGQTEEWSQPDLSPYLVTGSPNSKKQYLWPILAIGFITLAVILGVIAYSYRAKTMQMTESLALGYPGEISMIDRREVEPLWGDLLSSTEPILVVYSNTLFAGTAESGMKLLKSLDSPGSSLGSPIIPQSEIEQSKQPVIEHYTGIGEVMGAYFLGDFFARVRHSSRVKRSLLLNWEDLKTENIVVLGSPAENLFLRDLPQKQDFVFKPMQNDDTNKADFGVLNTAPKAGEQAKYFARQDGPSRSQISEDYSMVSLLRGVTGKKRMLILAGITTLGTQAAAEYVTKADYIRDLIQHLNIAPFGQPAKLPDNFQVLIKVKVNGGVPVQLSYVTHHALDR